MTTLQAHTEAVDIRTARVLVVDRKGELARRLADAVAEDADVEILRLARPTSVVEAVAEASPDVIVAAPQELTAAGLRRLAQVHRADPRRVILLAPDEDAHMDVAIEDAAACGVSDVLPYRSTPARMRVKIRAAIERAAELRPNVGAPAFVEEPAPATAPTPTTDGRAYTVTSATGGCGKTFFATNLASYLVKATRKRVVLVDLDLQFGEVAIALRLRPERTIAELVDEEDIDASLPDHVVTHRSGFDVLCAPKDPLAAERVGPREAAHVLEAAKRAYDIVVVDTPPAMNEVVLAAFDRSEELVVMATVDVPSLRNLKVFLDTLERLDLPVEDVTMLLNKDEPGTGVDPARLTEVYGRRFTAVLPYAREVTRSLNAGVPVMDSHPTSPISAHLFEGARRIVEPEDDRQLPWGATPRGGWWSHLVAMLKGGSR